jgi:hypothetical protein
LEWLPEAIVTVVEEIIRGKGGELNIDPNESFFENRFTNNDDVRTTGTGRAKPFLFLTHFFSRRKLENFRSKNFSK